MSSMFRFRRARGPLDLALEMAGVRMGERFVHVGAGDPRVFALLSSKVGLTGRACAIVDTRESLERLEQAAAAQGVLVEVAAAEAGSWPYENGSFDVAVLDANALLAGTSTDRMGRLAETVRVVRPGGRILAILRRGRGIGARLGFEPDHTEPTPEAAALLDALTAAGCRPARVLAEREGLAFVEGFAPAFS